MKNNDKSLPAQHTKGPISSPFRLEKFYRRFPEIAIRRLHEISISQASSEQLLRWKGIEATLKIAESTNAKVIIIGSGKDGLPIILDTK